MRRSSTDLDDGAVENRQRDLCGRGEGELCAERLQRARRRHSQTVASRRRVDEVRRR